MLPSSHLDRISEGETSTQVHDTERGCCTSNDAEWHRCELTMIFARLVLVVVLGLLILGASVYELINGQETRHICANSTTMIECSGEHDTSCPFGACISSPCGYKLATGIDVSVFGSIDNVSTEAHFVSVMMVVWSVVPYAVVMVLFGVFILSMDTYTLSFLCLLAVLTVFNEGLLKHTIQQDRPMGSCMYKKSYGMPSGHATTSFGLLVYTLLECNVDQALCSSKFKLIVSFLVMLLLAPVPYSRVYLADHYPEQVAIGAAEGTVLAVLWFLFMYEYARLHLAQWVIHVHCIGLRNTYRNEERFIPSPLKDLRSFTEMVETVLSTSLSGSLDDDGQNESPVNDEGYPAKSCSAAKLSGTDESGDEEDGSGRPTLSSMSTAGRETCASWCDIRYGDDR